MLPFAMIPLPLLIAGQLKGEKPPENKTRVCLTQQADAPPSELRRPLQKCSPDLSNNMIHVHHLYNK
jgi:hypothetical protein